MKIEGNPFATVDWDGIPETRHPGERGVATWRTVERGNVRTRLVEYSAGYVADHRCERGHVVFVLAGALVSELADGRRFTLTAGQSYVASDGAPGHRSLTESGARLFIVD